MNESQSVRTADAACFWFLWSKLDRLSRHPDRFSLNRSTWSGRSFYPQTVKLSENLEPIKCLKEIHQFVNGLERIGFIICKWKKARNVLIKKKSHSFKDDFQSVSRFFLSAQRLKSAWSCLFTLLTSVLHSPLPPSSSSSVRLLILFTGRKLLLWNGMWEFFLGTEPLSSSQKSERKCPEFCSCSGCSKYCCTNPEVSLASTSEKVRLLGCRTIMEEKKKKHQQLCKNKK